MSETPNGQYIQHGNFSGQPLAGQHQLQPQQQQLQQQVLPQPQPLQPQQQQLQQTQMGYVAQPTQPAPVPTFQQGWGYQKDYPTATPQAPPRPVFAEPRPKKRALELEAEEEEEVAYVSSARGRGRGRGRGGRGGILWGWVRFGHYKSRPPFPSCLAHKRPECESCFEWVWN